VVRTGWPCTSVRGPHALLHTQVDITNFGVLTGPRRAPECISEALLHSCARFAACFLGGGLTSNAVVWLGEGASLGANTGGHNQL
jgi:hypothetical protein